MHVVKRSEATSDGDTYPWSPEAAGEAPFNWRGGFWYWQPVTWPQWQKPWPPPMRPPLMPTRLGWHLTVQCRDAAWSANTVLPAWCWWGHRKHTASVTAALRNGVPCRCFCPPGRCEGKAGVQRHFRPHPPRRHAWW